MAYKKINDFITLHEIIDDDYYGFMHDDDMYIPEFIEKVKKQTSKIIVFSMSRGQFCPKDGHPIKWPPRDLWISKLEDITIGNIDFCQIIIKGEILKQTKFNYSKVTDDGEYAEELVKKWSNDILIIPEIGINFNYFQMGRYIKKIDISKYRNFIFQK